MNNRTMNKGNLSFIIIKFRFLVSSSEGSRMILFGLIHIKMQEIDRF